MNSNKRSQTLEHDNRSNQTTNNSVKTMGAREAIETLFLKRRCKTDLLDDDVLFLFIAGSRRHSQCEHFH